MTNQITKLSPEEQQFALQVQKLANANDRQSKALIAAVQSERIAVVKNKDVVALISEAVEKARFDLGLRSAEITDEDNDLFVSSLLADLRLNFPALGVDEIKIVIYNFVRGKYTPADRQIFLTVANLNKAFEVHMNDMKRQQAKAAALLALPPPEEKTAPTPEEVERQRIEIIVSAFEKFKLKGYYYDASNFVYTAIELYKKIPFDKKRKDGFLNEARVKLKTDNSRTSNTTEERKVKKAFIQILSVNTAEEADLLEDGIKQRAQMVYRALVSEAKNIALNAFFGDLKEFDADILEFLELNNDE